MNRTKNLAALNAEIEETKTKLKALYARRKELLTGKKKPASSDHQQQMVFSLAKAGLSHDAIAKKLDRSPSTVKHYLWSAIWWDAHESLLAAGKATVVRPNEHGGTTWNVDRDDLYAEVARINSSLKHGLSDLRLGIKQTTSEMRAPSPLPDSSPSA